MRAKECYCSPAMSFFKDDFMKKYGLDPFQGGDCVVFGMYKNRDYEILKGRKTIVVWGGSDSMKINSHRAKLLKNPNIVRHVAQSSFISRDLTRFGIKHICVPVTPAVINLPLKPRGDDVYCYYGSEKKKGFYGYEIAKEVEQRTGLKFHFTFKGAHNKEDLKSIYEKCFIGLRLTPRDGVAVTAVELGMMGRRVVFNGDSPNSIKWSGVEDIVENVLKEYALRKEDNSSVRESVLNYLNISEEWLEF